MTLNGSMLLGNEDLAKLQRYFNKSFTLSLLYSSVGGDCPNYPYKTIQNSTDVLAIGKALSSGYLFGSYRHANMFQGCPYKDLKAMVFSL